MLLALRKTLARSPGGRAAINRTLRRLMVSCGAGGIIITHTNENRYMNGEKDGVHKIESPRHTVVSGGCAVIEFSSSRVASWLAHHINHRQQWLREQFSSPVPRASRAHASCLLSLASLIRPSDCWRYHDPQIPRLLRPLLPSRRPFRSSRETSTTRTPSLQQPVAME